MKRSWPVAVLFLGFWSAGSIDAKVVEAKLTLPVEPKLALTRDDRVAIAPFVIATSAEQDQPNRRESRVDVLREFQRYLSKNIAREASAEVTVIDDVQLTGGSVAELVADQGFWRGIGRRYGADIVISGIIDFDIEDKVGYRSEEYVSPLDGRTYYRQVLVETTGFVFDIVVLIFDGETGEKLVEENFRDFKELRGRNFDEVLGLFQNLRSLETKIIGLFVKQEVASTRYLFTR